MKFPSDTERPRPTRSRRFTAAAITAALVLSGHPAHGAEPEVPNECEWSARGQIGVPGADPSVIGIDEGYLSAQAGGGGIQVRRASTLDGLAAAPARLVWSNTHDLGSVWAPEVVHDGSRYYIYFSAGGDSTHRMYVISSDLPDSGYGTEGGLALPGDRWAIDGVPVTFEGQRYFIWSGWGCTAVEQNLYITRMSDPLTPIGARYVVSRPREPWERVVGGPFVNEAPEVIEDPGGQLHVVYSANGSWSDQYCVADLRLRAEGDPTHAWDWYKSTGCLFGSSRATMMTGWDPTVHVNGPGHHSFALHDGDMAARMTADQHAEVNIELNEIGAASVPVLDRLTCPVRFVLATGDSLGSRGGEMEQGRTVLEPLLAGNPNLEVSAKVASNHSKILRNNSPAVAQAVRELAVTHGYASDEPV